MIGILVAITIAAMRCELCERIVSQGERERSRYIGRRLVCNHCMENDRRG